MELVSLSISSGLASSDPGSQIFSLSSVLSLCAEGKDITEYVNMLQSRFLTINLTRTPQFATSKKLAYMALGRCSAVIAGAHWVALARAIDADILDCHMSFDHVEVAVCALRCLALMPHAHLSEYFKNRKEGLHNLMATPRPTALRVAALRCLHRLVSPPLVCPAPELLTHEAVKNWGDILSTLIDDSNDDVVAETFSIIHTLVGLHEVEFYHQLPPISAIILQKSIVDIFGSEAAIKRMIRRVASLPPLALSDALVSLALFTVQRGRKMAADVVEVVRPVLNFTWEPEVVLRASVALQLLLEEVPGSDTISAVAITLLSLLQNNASDAEFVGCVLEDFQLAVQRLPRQDQATLLSEAIRAFRGVSSTYPQKLIALCLRCDVRLIKDLCANERGLHTTVRGILMEFDDLILSLSHDAVLYAFTMLYPFITTHDTLMRLMRLVALHYEAPAVQLVLSSSQFTTFMLPHIMAVDLPRKLELPALIGVFMLVFVSLHRQHAQIPLSLRSAFNGQIVCWFRGRRPTASGQRKTVDALAWYALYSAAVMCPQLQDDVLAAMTEPYAAATDHAQIIEFLVANLTSLNDRPESEPMGTVRLADLLLQNAEADGTNSDGRDKWGVGFLRQSARDAYKLQDVTRILIRRGVIEPLKADEMHRCRTRVLSRVATLSGQSDAVQLSLSYGMAVSPGTRSRGLIGELLVTVSNRTSVTVNGVRVGIGTTGGIKLLGRPTHSSHTSFVTHRDAAKTLPSTIQSVAGNGEAWYEMHSIPASSRIEVAFLFCIAEVTPSSAFVPVLDVRLPWEVHRSTRPRELQQAGNAATSPKGKKSLLTLSASTPDEAEPEYQRLSCRPLPFAIDHFLLLAAVQHSMQTGLPPLAGLRGIATSAEWASEVTVSYPKGSSPHVLRLFRQRCEMQDCTSVAPLRRGMFLFCSELVALLIVTPDGAVESEAVGPMPNPKMFAGTPVEVADPTSGPVTKLLASTQHKTTAADGDVWRWKFAATERWQLDCLLRHPDFPGWFQNLANLKYHHC